MPREEWEFCATDVVASALMTSFRDGQRILEMVPNRAAGLAFQHVVEGFADYPFHVETEAPHWGEDSVSRRVSQILYTFRVPAGELIFYMPTPVPPEAPQQETTALSQGYAVARGETKEPAFIEKVMFINRFTVPLSFFRTTLREYRAYRPSPDKATAKH